MVNIKGCLVHRQYVQVTEKEGGVPHIEAQLIFRCFSLSPTLLGFKWQILMRVFPLQQSLANNKFFAICHNIVFLLPTNNGG